MGFLCDSIFIKVALEQDVSSFVDVETRDAGELDPSDLLYVETGRTPDKVLNSRPAQFVWCDFIWFEYASVPRHDFPYFLVAQAFNAQ
ncbi:hypothetical protein N8157_03240 [Burkholderiales bacterium]|nr:hypothetical protein [Burkholderiales bacterium]